MSTKSSEHPVAAAEFLANREQAAWHDLSVWRARTKRDAATHAREASDIAVANADTSDGPTVPKASSTRVSAALAKRSDRENASNDMGQPGSAVTSKRYAKEIAISGPAARAALQISRDG